ncbi:MAG: hypothetical protein RIB47_16085 [Cyclobacteriaceae bacterium]
MANKHHGVYSDVGSNAENRVKHKYATQHYVSYRLVWCIPLLWALYNLIIEERFIVGGLVALILFLVITTHYGIEIDTKKKTFCDYLWLAGIKLGAPTPYNRIDQLFAKNNKATQGGYFLSAMKYSFQKDQFDGFIKFDGVTKIRLSRKEDKRELMKILDKISHDLGLEIIDYTN